MSRAKIPGVKRALALGLLLCACSPVEAPTVDLSALDDTADTQGPYPVEAHVTSRRSLTRVELVFHEGDLPAARILMQADELGIFRADLPGFGAGATVSYHVEALDDRDDRGYGPERAAARPGCGAELCFHVLP